MAAIACDVASGQNFKCLRTHSELFKHAFIVSTGEEWHPYFERRTLAVDSSFALPKCLASNSVDTAGPLFEHSGVPCKVVMNNSPAMAVEINAFRANRR